MADPKPSPLPALLLLLSVTTGLVDAVSVLGLGKVFTANMTGNIVFLGFAAAGAPGFSVPPYLIALASFLAGAAIAGRVGAGYAGRALRHWLTAAAAIEATLLGLAALVAGHARLAGPTLPDTHLYAIIALTAVAMGFRNATVRRLKVPDLTTTVLTLTLTGIAADSGVAGGNNPAIGRRLAAVAAMLLGAWIGGTMVLRLGLGWPLALAGAVVLVSTLAFARHPASDETAA